MPHTEVAPQEAGKVRVFALSLSDAEARAMRDDETAQAAALGIERIDGAYTEVFRVADLDQLGLPGYLRDGNGVNPNQIEKDRSRLGALDGWVLIVYSRAFAGQSLQLSPIPALTHIGTYTEGGPDTPVQAMEAEAAQPYTGIPRVSPPKPAKGSGGKTMVIVGVAVLVLIVIWWLLA
ncbi:hypothetical protein DSM110093_00691 [Sulfitobacter sp. DSM 110093]|uniref:hypothetical protein n=1 Tax=Sulfitobacter sp. DSM 110093 TaxID=2883127 RepID=UPI001FAE3C62|nr:hypothetical protein [Sulfitobacter sp. DSM 110093]UOA30931.1 hypothetical protein DSM110093_00691 [Sulfitobacter sp. DSM 110093]